MSRAIADAVALAVERRQRHQHDIGNRVRRRPATARGCRAAPSSAGRRATRRETPAIFRATSPLAAPASRPARRACASRARDRSRCGSASSRTRPCRAGSRTARRALPSLALRPRAVRRSTHRVSPARRCGGRLSTGLPSCGILFCRHRPRQDFEAIQYSRDVRNQLAGRGVLDTRFRGYDECARDSKPYATRQVSAKPRTPLKHSIPEFPTKVGGHHMSGSTDPARDSSLKDR